MFLLTSALCVSTSKSIADSGEVPAKIVHFYPNPASTNIYFEFQRGIEKGYILQVYNFIGKKLADLPINSSKISFNVESFYRGLYVFQLRDKTGSILESGKFQVIK